MNFPEGKERICVARALVEPEFIVCDECFSNGCVHSSTSPQSLQELQKKAAHIYLFRMTSQW